MEGRRLACTLQARQQVQEMVWMKQSENMVLEAMTRLSTVYDALEDLLRAGINDAPLQQARPARVSHDAAAAARTHAAAPARPACAGLSDAAASPACAGCGRCTPATAGLGRAVVQ